MAHGGGGDGEGGGERWLVSYADFITLLMVLFVVLYSMGQVDVEKYKRLAENMRMAFTLGGPSQVIDSQINQSGGTSEDGEPKPIVVPGIPESPPASAEVAGQLTQMLAGTGLGNEVSVQTNIEGVLISLSEKLIFSPGSSELPPEAMPVLETIVNMVRTIDNPIRLVGHTDDSPSTDPRYPTNWDLSVARASHVAQYLINAGIDPQRLIVSGRSQYDPIFPNDTDEHRSMNSRVDIIIVYEVENNVFGSQTIKIAP
ncbi:MAG: OmpA family protein [Anaerolineae bacterium]|nr:OmpA family protein [Anaerolineae bacterium]